MNDAPLFVTRSFLPPKEEYEILVRQAFENHHLTNHGPLETRLNNDLRDFLPTQHLCLTANGTLALMLALRQAGLSGKKVITTPYTYVATLSALLWEGCTPLFADIDPHSMCISPESIEKILKEHPDAAGVLAVHVYGNVCDVEALEALCNQHNLLCIYDAAHAFGTKYKGRSALDFGDYAACSFHATKLFHSAEGGCVVCHSKENAHQLHLLSSFGHSGDTHYTLGINVKMSELHAAMGLAVLPYVRANSLARQKISLQYEALLPMEAIKRPCLRDGLEYNYAYFPIIFESESCLLKAKKALEANNIFPRRYFYPSLTTLPYLPEITKKFSCPVAESIARRALCLPLHEALETQYVEQIAAIVRASLGLVPK